MADQHGNLSAMEAVMCVYIALAIQGFPIVGRAISVLVIFVCLGYFPACSGPLKARNNTQVLCKVSFFINKASFYKYFDILLLICV